MTPTEAGKRLLDNPDYHVPTCPLWSGPFGGDSKFPCRCDLPAAIAAIEAEAVVAERARIVAAVAEWLGLSVEEVLRKLGPPPGRIVEGADRGR